MDKMSKSGHKIRLYNTLSKAKERFEPIDPDNVRMYVCGPTVYDYAHIGNARPAIVFDVLFRLLRQTYGADHVTYLRNITDVDDKINARAARDFPGVPLNEAIRKLTATTERQYQDDMKELGCLDPTRQPRATENIDEMIAMITTLIEQGHAYEAQGHVLFRVASFRQGEQTRYGELSHRSLDDMIAGARVEVAPYKKDPMDFVLWKPSDDDQPGWDSPWGNGRPGWHIECSAMSRKFLGPTFDIHGGGIDLSFPHHENERAQSCCANGTERMARIWMHNGFLQINGEKMSKSLGNFFTVHELLHGTKFGGRSWPGDVLRLAMLTRHYREPIDLSVDRLTEAERMLERWKRAMAASGLDFVEANRGACEALGPCSKLLAALSDDMNMAGVLTHLHRHAKASESGTRLHNAQRLFGSLNLLGIVSFDSMKNWQEATEKLQENADVDVEKITVAIAQRKAALAEKNWAEADRIRDQLASEGIRLTDSKDTETGERITRWEVVK